MVWHDFKNYDYLSKKQAYEKQFSTIINNTLIDESLVLNLTKYVIPSLACPKPLVAGSNSKQYKCLFPQCLMIMVAKFRLLDHFKLKRSKQLPFNGDFLDNRYYFKTNFEESIQEASTKKFFDQKLLICKQFLFILIKYFNLN